MSTPSLAEGDYFIKRDAESNEIDDGWAVVRKTVDEDGDEHEDLLGILDTETLADVVMRALAPDRVEFEPDAWYGPY